MSPHTKPRNLARRINEQAVLDAIFLHGPLSRVKVAALTGLSKPTVASIVDDLVAGGLVQVGGRTRGRVGRTATLFRVDGGVAHVVAIDLGGTKVNAAVADIHGRTILERTEPTDVSGAEALVEQLRQIARRAAAEAGIAWSSVRVIAVGVPGTVEPATGAIRLAPNIPDLTRFPLATELRRDFEGEVLIENDVNLAALGEHWQGLAVGLENFVFIGIGTGIGAGVVVNGELCHGAGGAGGEIGYLPIGADPFDPDSHVRGALEEAVGGRGIALEARRRLAAGGAGELTPDCTAADVFAAAARGDALAIEVVDAAARHVALAVAAVKAIVAPELVILGGGVGANPQLLEPIRRYTERLLAEPLRIEISGLGTRAPLVGAVAFALDAARSLVLSPSAGATAPAEEPASA
jgi:predicted NBD/HSP70 family sugar kinase